MTIQERAAKVLQEIDAELVLAEKATAGPWTTFAHDVHCLLNEDISVASCGTLSNSAITEDEADNNAAFIAASRNGWPTALRCLKTAITGLLEFEKLSFPLSSMARNKLTDLCNQWESK